MFPSSCFKSEAAQPSELAAHPSFRVIELKPVRRKDMQKAGALYYTDQLSCQSMAATLLENALSSDSVKLLEEASTNPQVSAILIKNLPYDSKKTKLNTQSGADLSEITKANSLGLSKLLNQEPSSNIGLLGRSPYEHLAGTWTSVDLPMHVDDATSKKPPDAIILFGINKRDTNVATTVLPLDPLLAKLSSSVIEEMRKPNFGFPTSPCRMIDCHADANTTHFRYRDANRKENVNFSPLGFGFTQSSNAAVSVFLEAMQEVLKEHLLSVSLGPDEALWIKNGSNASSINRESGFGAIHGRSGKGKPYKARKAERLLARVYFKNVDVSEERDVEKAEGMTGR